MFEVKVEGVEELLAKISKYDAQITELHTAMPQELETWQRDDMKRKYPNTQVDARSNETAATTMIWPTSRTPSKRERRYQKPKQHRPSVSGPVVRSHRPILRAELWKQLYERMMKLTSEAVKWP